MSGPIPQWAYERALEEVNSDGGEALSVGQMIAYRAGLALARYIAAHEEPPVDPLLIEAREIAAETYANRRDHDFAGWIRRGGKDHIYEVQVALAALKRGIELASKSEPLP